MPPAAVKIAVSKARATFHTTAVRATVKMRSKRDPHWVLVGGMDSQSRHIWASWLRGDRHGWQLRYFDTKPTLQPQSTKHGRVPCDIYPAFAEPRC